MKIGVFICHCGFNIAEIIDIEALMDRIRKDEELILIEDDYVCSEQGLNKLKENLHRTAFALFRHHGNAVQYNMYVG